MEAVLLTKSKVNEIKKALNESNDHLITITSPFEPFLDKNAFEKLMGISSRTAQIWRDEGRIGFSQNGKLIYYRMSDIHKFLDDHHRKPFHRGNSNN